MSSPRVGYRELAALLRGQIESGQLRPGDRVPSENDLMQGHGVARETARRAVRGLRDEGLIDSRHGYPSRVRVERERTEIRVQRGSTWVARMPTAAERIDLGIGPGVAVVEVTLGAKTAVYAGDRHTFTCL